MSFHTWIEYGYGCRIDHIETSKSRIDNRLAQAPNFELEFIADLRKACGEAENEIDAFTLEDYLEWSDGCTKGLAPIMRAVIRKKEGIELNAPEDFEGRTYLLFPPAYPWFRGEKEKNMTAQDVEQLFHKYLKFITDEEIKIGYEECENGC